MFRGCVEWSGLLVRAGVCRNMTVENVHLVCRNRSVRNLRLIDWLLIFSRNDLGEDIISSLAAHARN